MCQVEDEVECGMVVGEWGPVGEMHKGRVGRSGEGKNGRARFRLPSGGNDVRLWLTYFRKATGLVCAMSNGSNGFGRFRLVFGRRRFVIDEVKRQE